MMSNFNTETIHKRSKCPVCGNELDATSGPGVPVPGEDVSVCIYCGTLLGFNPDLTPCTLSPEMERQAMANPEIFGTVAAVRAYIKRKAS